MSREVWTDFAAQIAFVSAFSVAFLAICHPSLNLLQLRNQIESHALQSTTNVRIIWHTGRASVWLAPPAMHVWSATQLDRTYSRWPGSLITALLSSRATARNGFAEARFVPQSQVASHLLAYEAGKSTPTIRDIHYYCLRKSAEPADLTRTKSSVWTTQPASKGKTQTHCRCVSCEAVKMPRSRSNMVQKDAALVQLFLAASLHLWDLLPSKSLKSYHQRERTLLKSTLTFLELLLTCCH